MIPRNTALSWLMAAAALPFGPSMSWEGTTSFASAFVTPHSRRMLQKPDIPNRDFIRPSQSSSKFRSADIALMATLPKETTSSSSAKSSSNSTELATPSDPLPSKDASLPISPVESNSKLRKLKDCMWVREALEDLTAAEFASSLSVEVEDSSSTSTNNNANGGNNKSNRKRAVDYDNLLSKLEARIEEMCVVTSKDIAQQLNQTCYVLDRRVVGEEGNSTIENLCYSLTDKMGMGAVVYTTDQREALLIRLMATRERLVNFIQGSISGKKASDDEIEIGPMDDIRSQMQPEDYVNNTEKGDLKSDASSSGKVAFDPSLYVREDGTIDWDGALQDREALKKFGSAVWSRINGQDPEISNSGDDKELLSGDDDFHSPSKAVTAKIVETDAIRQKRDRLDVLKNELHQMEVEHTKLLNSGKMPITTITFDFFFRLLTSLFTHLISSTAISPEQAVANVNFATINPALRMKIRLSSDELDKKKGEVSFHTLNYELERIYTYLEGELGNTATKGYIPLQDRLNVAEFGLLESQIDSFNRQMELGEILDSDVLAIVTDQLTDFKRRLGIDYYVTGLTFDSDAFQIWFKDILQQAKKGLAFYVKGTQLFIDDLVFCLNLIGRALQGYTLKPREVRTLR